MAQGIRLDLILLQPVTQPRPRLQQHVVGDLRGAGAEHHQPAPGERVKHRAGLRHWLFGWPARSSPRDTGRRAGLPSWPTAVIRLSTSRAIACWAFVNPV